MRVDPDARAERRPEACDRARRRREVTRWILGVEPDLERVAAPRCAAGQRERLARRDAQLLADDVDAGDELADGVLDLKASVQLDEVEGSVGAEQELERARVLVADRPAGALGRRLHLLARVGVERRRGRLLDQLLVAPLDRALALAEREHAAVLVAEHLDLDVPRRHERLLEVEGAVRERGLGLGAGRRVRRLERVGVVNEAHALAASARGRLQQNREAELRGRSAHLRQRGAALAPGDERHAGRLHLGLRARLVAHPLHHVRARTDEDEIVVLARPHEGRVLGEEAVAGMDGLAAGRLGGGDHVRDAEVALRGGGRADADGAVGEADVERVPVGGRVDGDGLGAELVDRADDPDGDLAAVRD